jgi:hypothetical protein
LNPKMPRRVVPTMTGPRPANMKPKNIDAEIDTAERRTPEGISDGTPRAGLIGRCHAPCLADFAAGGWNFSGRAANHGMISARILESRPNRTTLRINCSTDSPQTG